MHIFCVVFRLLNTFCNLFMQILAFLIWLIKIDFPLFFSAKFEKNWTTIESQNIYIDWPPESISDLKESARIIVKKWPLSENRSHSSRGPYLSLYYNFNIVTLFACLPTISYSWRFTFFSFNWCPKENERFLLMSSTFLRWTLTRSSFCWMHDSYQEYPA